LSIRKLKNKTGVQHLLITSPSSCTNETGDSFFLVAMLTRWKEVVTQFLFMQSLY